MKTIYKYPIEFITEDILIEMPYGAEILTIQVQNGIACIWAIVDDKEYTTFNKSFKIFGTGHKLPDNISGLKYIGTFQLYNGNLVFHVFEVI